jgi:hypothetical protein
VQGWEERFLNKGTEEIENYGIQKEKNQENWKTFRRRGRKKVTNKNKVMTG